MLKKICIIMAMLLTSTLNHAIAEKPSSKSSPAQSAVQASATTLTIPTYGFGVPDKNPFFYKDRRYQGAQGPVYPYPMLDALNDQCENKDYQTLKLENKYLEISVLPELGGRLYSGLDKTNQYDFFYRNRVIKPALVGMAGAWLSGGVEWNIPHHHRVSTCMPVDSRIVENPDGSKTIWVGETEWRHRMKWMLGLTLHPDRSYLEITTKIINRTPVAHSMLCWANAAVHVNGNYQVIFSPKVRYGTYHAKWEFTTWPVGSGNYHGLDRTGTDLSWWKNNSSSISIFAWNDSEDFLGGYDHGKNAGVVHVADHNIAPGKKFFTWGSGEEGFTWDSVLTEDDGPYIELMTGAYSDNQPDYSWIQPYETRIIHEYWYPLRSLGGIKNANREAAVNLELGYKGKVRIAVNTTAEYQDAKVKLEAGGKILFEKKETISPAQPFVSELAVDSKFKAEDLRLSVWAGETELIHYQAEPKQNVTEPEGVTPPKLPRELKTCDELYQMGLRLEQFHNGVVSPYPYYEEALKREPSHSGVNAALGILYCKRGMFVQAEKHLQTATDFLSARYTRPKDTEALYYLGVALRGQGKYEAAEKAFQQARWGYAWRAASCYALAEFACRNRDYAKALEFVNLALTTNIENTKALTFKVMVLRKLKRYEEASAIASEIQRLYPLDFWSANEMYLLALATEEHENAKLKRDSLTVWMRGDANSYLEMATDYFGCGQWAEVIEVLKHYTDAIADKGHVSPLAYYYMAFAAKQKGDDQDAQKYLKLASEMSTDYCFPFRLESIDVLRDAVVANPDDAKAYYYLGNVLYPIQPEKAIAAWERARELNPGFVTIHRNLGVAYADIQHDYNKGVASLRKAFLMTPDDPVVLNDFEAVADRAGVDTKERLALFDKYATTSAKRDDSRLAHVNLCVLQGQYDRALKLLAERHFRRWEGDDGPPRHVCEDTSAPRARVSCGQQIRRGTKTLHRRLGVSRKL